MSKYVNKLTKRDIAKFLDTIGYCFNESIYDDMGEQVPAYEKYTNRKTKECEITAKCIKSKQDPLLNKIKTLIPFNTNSYFNGLETAILLIHDYKVSSITLDSATDFQNSYAKFMYEKFGEEYKKDYNNFVKQQIKERNDKNKIKEK